DSLLVAFQIGEVEADLEFREAGPGRAWIDLLVIFDGLFALLEPLGNARQLHQDRIAIRRQRQAIMKIEMQIELHEGVAATTGKLRRDGKQHFRGTPRRTVDDKVERLAIGDTVA